MSPIVKLHRSEFEAALASYIEDAKPDPLARRQIENIIVEWEQNSDIDGKADSSDDKAPMDASDSKLINGKVTMFGEYMSVDLEADCKWMWMPSQSLNGNETINASASLSFRLIASARSIPLTQYKRLQKGRQKRIHSSRVSDESDTVQEKGAKADRMQQKAQAKVRSGMLDRLKRDAYIKKLLDATEEKGSSSKSNHSNYREHQQHVLCTAEIRQSFDSKGNVKDIEERVDISEDVVEGVRRAILSQFEDNTSVVELLLALPLLPKDEATKQDNGQSIELQLGHRAVLRLLEDAMLDACEKEGEDELLDDLDISGNKLKDDYSSDGDCNGEGSEPSTRKKKSRR